nr:hypothetical protein DM860_007927 [Ipomoea trifida]
MHGRHLLSSDLFNVCVCPLKHHDMILPPSRPACIIIIIYSMLLQKLVRVWVKIRSEPESSGVFKERDEGAVDMTSHDGLDPAQEFSAHEDGGDGLAAGGGPRELEEEGVDLAAVGVAVELHDGGADPEAEEELLHHVAHAAAAEGEDHHRVAGGQEADPLVDRLHAHRRG